MSGHLWLLACGRRRTPRPSTAAAIAATLRSSASISTISAGVSTSSSRSPIRAGNRAAAAPASRLLIARIWRRSPESGLGRCGFGRREVAVDNASDREQLRFVDPARQCVAARVVYPVENADAVLERVAERRLGRVLVVLAHQQRDTLL